MSLQVWLPLTKDTKNQGLFILPTPWDTRSRDTGGKLGQYCYSDNAIYHIEDEWLGNEWSLASWVKSSSWGQYNDIILCKNATTSDAAQFYLSIIGGTQLNIGCNAGSQTLTVNYTFATNTWYHVAATYDGTILKLYLNGNEVGNKTYSSTQKTGMNNLGIGCRSTNATGTSGTGNTGVKRLNDVRIYDHCLSPIEVKLISQGLVLHYPLNRQGWGQDNILTNSSGYEGTSNWSGLVTVGNENGRPYLIAKRTDNSSSSRTFCTHTAITNLVSSWNAGDKFTISGYYKVPSTETYAVGGNMFIRWADQGTRDTGFITPTTLTKDVWIRFEKVFTVPDYDTTGSVNFYLSAFSKGLSTIYWKDIKLEHGDRATPWIPAVTDTLYSTIGLNSTTEYDCSGFCNNGTRTGTFTWTSDTPKYAVSQVFNGTDNAIQTPNLTTMITDKNYTIACWTYKTVIGTKNYQTIYGGPSGFELEARSSSSTSPLYRIHNWGGGTTTYNFGEWTHFCFVHTDSDSKLYVNGELKITGTSVNIPSGNYFVGAWKTSTSQNYEGNISDFRIYATALSADDVKSLYQNCATIDPDGTIRGQIRN